MIKARKAVRRSGTVAGVLGIAAFSVLGGCSRGGWVIRTSDGFNQSAASGYPQPEFGLTSPFAKGKVQLSASFAQKVGTGSVAANLANPTATIPAGAGLTVIVKDACLKARHSGAGSPIQYFIDKYIDGNYYGQAIGKFDESALPINLRAAISLADLRRISQVDPCIVGMTDTQKYLVKGAATANPVAYNDPGFPAQQAYLQQIGFPQADAYFSAAIPSSVKVNVAVIDTGFDLSNEDIGPLNDILDGSDMAGASNRPQDTDGHGTQVASLISAQGNNGKGIVGIASRNTKLLPIRLFGKAVTASSSQISSPMLFQSVKLAVNAGAEVVNMSFATDANSFGGNDANSMSCDILAGYAIYRAIQGGAFFTIAAGQWTQKDAAGNLIPGAVTAPKENGPLPLGANSVPACWGRYYKGALTVGALQTGTQTLASFSNWGSDAVEIAAPGTAMQTYGLANQLMLADGSSLAAAEVAAAAALTIAFHKQQGWPYSPWLIEDVILNGSSSSAGLQSPADGRAVHGGKMLDLNALAGHLQQLQQENADQRLHEPSENPESGVVFQAGNGPPSQGTLSNLQIYTDTPFIQNSGADRVQFQTVAYFSNASFEVVTDGQGVTYSVSDATKASVDAHGLLVPVAGATGLLTVNAAYLGKTASTTITLTNFNILTGMQSALVGLSLAGRHQAPDGSSVVIPLFDPAQLTQICPLPHPAGGVLPAYIQPGAMMGPNLGGLTGGLNLNSFTVLARYADGTVRDLGGAGNGTVGNPVSFSVTKPDGSRLDNDDVGGSTVLLTSLYRGQKAQMSYTHAILPATGASILPANVTVTRGNPLNLQVQIQTSGTCGAILANNWFNDLAQDPGTGAATVASVTNPNFTFAADSPVFHAWVNSISFSSPQPELNALLQGRDGIPTNLTMANALPAGTYTVNGALTYRGGAGPQTINIAPFNFTLVENKPVAVLLRGNANRLGSGFGPGPYSIAGQQGWNSYAAGVQLGDGTVVSAPYNFTWTVKDQSGAVISQDATVPADKRWVDVTNSGAGHDNIQLFLFTGNVGDSYTVEATETSTGLKASMPFSVSVAPVFHYTGPNAGAAQPSLEAPSPVPAAAPANGFCTAAAAALAPFAGGSGTSQDPFLICTPAQFMAISKSTLAKGYYLIKQNLDFGSLGSMAQKGIAASGQVFLDGGGFEIQNYTAVDTEARNLGIFANLTGGSISHLVIRNPLIQGVYSGALIGILENQNALAIDHVDVLGGTISGGAGGSPLNFSLAEWGVGGLIGTAYAGRSITITNSHVLGTQLSSQYGGAVGGLVGSSVSSGIHIADSGVEATIGRGGVPGAMPNVGGLVGTGDDGIQIVSSYSKGTISGGTDSVGGLVGKLGTNSGIYQSATSMEVVAQGSGVGGLVGNLHGSWGFDGSAVIYGCLATGRVWGGQSNAGSSNAGGLVGYSSMALIENSKATGSVSGVSNVGGLIGMDAGFNQIYGSSAQGKASASAGSVGGFGGLKTALDRHDLDGIYSGNTWSASANPGAKAYGSYLSQTAGFTPAGISGQ